MPRLERRIEPPDRVYQALAQVDEWVLEGATQEDVYLRAEAALQALSNVSEGVAATRRVAVRAMRGQGYSLGELAEAFGVSRERIRQIEGA